MRTRYLVVLVVFLLLVGLGAGLLGGVFIDRQLLASTGAAAPAQIPQDAVTEFDLMGQAWTTIRQNYVDQTAAQPMTMTYGAISGMVDALGDIGHSRFLSPQAVAAENDFSSGKIEGVGLEVEEENGHVVIVAPIDGSPAQKAGLKAGEIIEKVNGMPVTGLPLEQVTGMILGTPGTTVTLTISNPVTGVTKDYTLTRAVINIANVTWQSLPGTTVVHLRIAGFSQNVANMTRDALVQILAIQPTGLILDLRNNPGGLLSEAVGAASQFLKSGNVLLERDVTGKITPVPVEPGGVATTIPMVTLINVGTASGAEIVAAALKDNNRSPLVGETTFGTGTVLRQFGLNDGSAILLAVQEWLTPNGGTIWHVGLSPTVTVTLPITATALVPEAERNMTAQDIQNSGDTQLLKALEMLSGSTGQQGPLLIKSVEGAVLPTLNWMSVSGFPHTLHERQAAHD
jgi:carboxyl-terminal processing protease